jgi:hypothetical protein
MSLDLSSTSSSDNQSKSNNTLYIILVVVVVIVFYFLYGTSMENMTGGTLTQLFANDSQDTYLKGNVDKLATGKFDLFWNQPTRIANTFLNRGSPLPSNKSVEVSNNNQDLKSLKSVPSINVLPLVISEQTGNSIPSINILATPIIESSQEINELPSINNGELTNIEESNASPTEVNEIVNELTGNIIDSINENNDEVVSLDMNNMKLSGSEIANTMNDIQNSIDIINKQDNRRASKCNGQCNNPKSCLKKCKKDPASCGGGEGGYRLETGFIDASSLPAYEQIDGNTVYPDSYVGSYWVNPIPDISEPYPVIVNRV